MTLQLDRFLVPEIDDITSLMEKQRDNRNLEMSLI